MGMALPGPDIRALAAAQHVAHGRPGRGQDVALLAVVVVEQRDTSVAVGVVLDGGNRGGDAVLVALEVDDAVLLLVAAAPVTGGLAAVGVAPTGAGLGTARRTCSGRVLVISVKSETVWNRRPALVGLRLRSRHTLSSPRKSGWSARWPESRWPAWCPAACRRSALPRLRLRLPGRFKVLTLTTLTPKIASTAWRISTLLASRSHHEDVDTLVEQGVGLLRHHRPDDDVAGVTHRRPPCWSVSSPARSATGSRLARLVVSPAGVVRDRRRLTGGRLWLSNVGSLVGWPSTPLRRRGSSPRSWFLRSAGKRLGW